MSGIRASASRRLLGVAYESLPRGRTLPHDAWQRRHRGIVWLLWAHAAGLLVLGMLLGYGVWHAVAHAAPVAAFALLARRHSARKVGAVLTSTGLLTASALLVHLTGGLIEAHFHFFVMIAVITLYEDWVPFGLAFAYVVLHHGSVGVLDAGGVYNHGAAQEHPWRWAVIHGVFVVGAGAANVVTWRLNEDVRAARTREFERRARDSEERFAAIVESSGDAIFAETVDGVIMSWNSGAERLYGYRAEDVVGREASMLVPPGRRAADLLALERLLAEGGIQRYETERLRSDGTLVPVSLSLSAIRDSTGAPVGAAAIARDITAQKRAERERETLLAREREQVERLRELDEIKDEFVALVSHELRTPLTSIRGYLELVLEEPSLNDEQTGFLRVVDRNAERLQKLVGDLLFIAQVEAKRVNFAGAPVDLADVANESVEAARPLAHAKRIALSLTCESVSTLSGDRDRIAQVLDNFVSNAIKFTPEGGLVEVHVTEAGNHAVLEIADTGIGIPPEEQDRLFQRFFRTSTVTASAIQGTGLGLAISRAIVEAHGGRITFTSAPAEGTTFRIELPLEPGVELAA